MALNIVMDTLSFPPEIIETVSRHISVTTTILSKTGLLDAFWTAVDNHTITLERKEVHDFVHRVDDLEAQLKNAMNKADEILLLIEGIIEPIDNSTVLYRQKKDGSLFFRERVVNRPYLYYMNFIWRLDKLGVSTFWTATPNATAITLVGMVQSSNKPEFTTFRRYLKQKPVIGTPNPQILKLMGLGLGETRATSLIERFGTVWNVLNASEDELLKVTGIGEKTIKELLEGIGKI